jgi:hypothetical protein
MNITYDKSASKGTTISTNGTNGGKSNLIDTSSKIVKYTPPYGYLGFDYFNYTITDYNLFSSSIITIIFYVY